MWLAVLPSIFQLNLGSKCCSLSPIDYADSLCEWIRIASYLGEVFSAKAFAQRMGALCEWIERVALYLSIHIENKVVMLLVGRVGMLCKGFGTFHSLFA
ncbi:hypothetical protein LR48_Vigan401s002400 [Vigna angularis]|uniref:Uncharacterized protein n=1 Tax=Phaseolus angularis TaxID=3914 RepID=A0A0L9TAG9_PHAAN|nr:hypothetical protein LR48_Vigan401s002400 [Vigna angularis]